MSTNKSKEKAQGNKAIVKANETALKGFPKSKVRTAFNTMAAQADESDSNNESRQAAALDVLKLARTFAVKNDGATTETIVDGWRDNIKLVTMELAIAGNRFADLTEGKDDKPATAKLTGYGNNVASIAKGVLEFEIDPNDSESYRDVRKSVEAARAEKRRSADPTQAAIDDAKEKADEAWAALRRLVFGLNQLGTTESLTEALTGHISDIGAQLAAESDGSEDAPLNDKAAKELAAIQTAQAEAA